MAYTETEARRCRQDFPALACDRVFLDGPAGTQVPRAVIDAITWCYGTCNVNSHGMFAASRQADQLTQETREAVAAFLGAPSWREVSFGQNMTTLNFSLSHALAREMKPGDEIVITQLDHESNRGPWLNLQERGQERGIVVREVPLKRDARLDEEELARLVNERTRLIALGYASNAFGTVNDIPFARRLADEVGAWLLVDAVHYAPHFPLDVTALDPDFLLCSAYKFYAPHVGILYTRPGLLDRLRTDKLRTQDDAAPYRIETGTLNLAALAGVKAGIEYIASWGEGETLRDRLLSARESVADYEFGLGAHFYDHVKEIPGVHVWGPDFAHHHRAPTVAITIEGVTPAQAAEKLGDAGIQVWDGHFYAIRAMEVLGLAERGGVLRTGVSMYNTREEIDRHLEEIARIVG